ncbi:MAG: V-type ATPase subunit [Clostridia bacterium]|nr:V-type ATPase subunit [Clostridia bacterium]
MAKDFTFTNGVIAVKEKFLLSDRILKLCDSGAEEALRALTDCGFGKGAEAASVYEFEKLISADGAAIDEFIREYAPSQTELIYLFAARDFHNAKAVVKAHCLGLEVENMLAPEGLISITQIMQCVSENKFEPLGEILGGATKAAYEKLTDTESGAAGAEIGAIFEKALFEYLSSVCKKNRTLKKLLAAKADMTNILVALRSEDAAEAAKFYVSGGSLSNVKLEKLFEPDTDKRAHALDGTPYNDFLALCLADKNANLPLTQAERAMESYEAKFFSARKYELDKREPFLYYVFRRRAENADVRILFVCLLAGMGEREIKARLRAV